MMLMLSVVVEVVFVVVVVVVVSCFCCCSMLFVVVVVVVIAVEASHRPVAVNFPPFPSTPFNLMISLSNSLTLSKALTFSSTADCPWNTSSVKHPNPVTTSFAESPVRKYLSSTEATVKLVISLIPLPRLDHCQSLLSGLIASSGHKLQRRHSKLCCSSHSKTNVKLTTSLLCFNLSSGFQSHEEFSTRSTLSAINASRALLYLIHSMIE